MKFYVKAIWDAESGVFYSESDIVGLHIEAATLDEFEVAMGEFAPQMVMENHISKADLAQRSLVDLIPSIFFRGALGGSVAA
jgi:hypothetical protein